MLRGTTLGLICWGIVVGCAPEAPVDTGYAQDPVLSSIVDGTLEPQTLSLTPGELLSLGFFVKPNGAMCCSGVLTSGRYALTAAHCFGDCGGDITGIQFGVGPSFAEPVALLPIREFHRFPQEDLGLVVLGQDATEYVPELAFLGVQTTALDDVGMVGQAVEATGYGTDGVGGSGTRRFAAVAVTAVEPLLLYVDGEGDRGYCWGDSGAPLLWRDGESAAPVIVGVEARGVETECGGVEIVVRTDAAASWLAELQADGPPPVWNSCNTEALTQTTWCADADLHRCRGGYEYITDCGNEPDGCGELDGEAFCLPRICIERGIDTSGSCEDTVLSWCYSAGIRSKDCSESGLACVFQEESNSSDCVDCVACDGVCTDIDTDPLHCGGCDRHCAPANATGTCQSGACQIVACTDGYEDADGEAQNGCEEPITEPSDSTVPESDSATSEPVVQSAPEGGCQSVRRLDVAWIIIFAGLLIWRRRVIRFADGSTTPVERPAS